MISYALNIMAIDGLIEQRVSRLEALFEDVLKERINFIALRLDQIYEKTEKDKAEVLTKTETDKTEIKAEIAEKFMGLYEKTEKDKAEIAEKFMGLYEKTEKDKAEILTKTERDKTELIDRMQRDKTELIDRMQRDKTELIDRMQRNKTELIYWMTGLVLGFSALTITAIWAILSFALR
ncbi:hypothetical protein M1N01_01505 [Thermodesulfovibrionales bacterium]|nr:hypothetical protein [Thermodesulfovibrionales bacterium]